MNVGIFAYPPEEEAATDTDGDTVPDNEDNCPLDANQDQEDSDLDDIGDACDEDDDNDGVSDAHDSCPDTPAGEVVDEDGCTIDQRCPCEAQWKNHLHYVLCVTRSAAHFVKQGLLTKKQAAAIVLEAVKSDCGKK